MGSDQSKTSKNRVIGAQTTRGINNNKVSLETMRRIFNRTRDSTKRQVSNKAPTDSTHTTRFQPLSHKVAAKSSGCRTSRAVGADESVDKQPGEKTSSQRRRYRETDRKAVPRLNSEEILNRMSDHPLSSNEKV